MSKNLTPPLTIAAYGVMTPCPPKGRWYTLQELQGIVGGYIEIVRIEPNSFHLVISDTHLKVGEGCVLVVNEEGELKGLRMNMIASMLQANPHDHIVGDVLLCHTSMLEGAEGEL